MENQNKRKHTEALELASEILKNIEYSEISLEKICLKCVRLARLCGDDSHEKAFRLEVSGYDNFPNGIPPDIFRIGKIANRVTKNKKGQEVCSTGSISQFETVRKLNEKRLEKINCPDLSPSNSIAEVSSDSDILGQIIMEMNNNISRSQEFIYSYVLDAYYKLFFENEVYSILINLAHFLQNNISRVIPEGDKKIVSIFDNLKSNNAQDWKNVLVTCRNLLKETAETLKPGSNDKYYNTLKNLVETSTLSKEDKKLLEQDITTLINPLNEGAHDNLVSRKKAEELFIRTSLCLSKIIEFNPKK